MAITLVDFEGGVVGQNVTTTGGVATITGTPKYVTGIQGDKGLGITVADYATLTAPTADTWSGAIYIKPTGAPTTGAARGVVISDSVAKWLGYVRFHQDGTWQYTNESTLVGTVGTWTLNTTYLIEWQVNRPAKTIQWRITPEGGAASTATSTWTSDSGLMSSAIGVGGSGAGAGSTFTADSYRYDTGLSWLGPYSPTPPVPAGVFYWDGQNEVPVSQSGAFPVDLTYPADPARPEFVIRNDYIANPGNRDTMQIWSHGEQTWWVNEWGGLRIRVAEGSPWDAPLRLIGASNQSGDMLEVQDSTRQKLLARITSTGKIVAPNVGDAPWVLLQGDAPLPANLTTGALVGRISGVGGSVPSTYDFFDRYILDAAASTADGWSQVAGTPPKYLAAAAWGSNDQGMRAATVSAATSYVQKQWTFPDDEFFARVRVRIPSLASGNVRVFQSSAVSGGLRHGVRLTSAGKIDIVDTGVAVRYTSTTSYTPGQWLDLGVHVKAGPTGVGFCYVRIYTDPTSDTAVESIGGTTGDWAGAGQALNGARVGIQTTSAATNTVDIGMFAYNNDEWVKASDANSGSVVGLSVYDGSKELPAGGGGGGGSVIAVTDIASIPPGTPAGTVVVITPAAGGNQPPVASFTHSVEGLAVSVNAAASLDPDGTVLSYEWNWGDGQTSTGVTAAHTYATAASRTITLKVTDNSGDTDQISKSVTTTAGGGAAAPPVLVSSVPEYFSSSTDMDLDKPADVQDGDYLVALFRGQNSAGQGELIVPSGWTRIGEPYYTSDSPRRFWGWYGKRVTTAAGEPTAYRFSKPTADGSRMTGVMINVRNVATDSVVGYGAATYSSGTVGTLPAATDADNSLALGGWACEATTGNTGILSGAPPSGWTQVAFTGGPALDGSTSATYVHVYAKTIATATGANGGSLAIAGPTPSGFSAVQLVLRGK